MKKTLIGVLAASLLASTIAWAQYPRDGKPENARFGDPTATGRFFQDLFYGVIKSLDKGELVLEKTKFGVDQSIKLNDKTKFVHDGAPSSFDKLKAGDQVWIQTKKDKKSGDMIAKKVFTGVVAPTVQK
ncbi:MAG: DUF5666 domain-containing protein [Acidobacteriia bacterium]|nr:DUF5666 domain-containing protein [Terriglobia bacterium]